VSAAERPHGISRRPLYWIAWFGAALSVVYGASWTILRGVEPRALVDVAVTLDLTVVVPCAYWLLLVRGAGWPRLSVVPVFVLSVVAASLVIPDARAAALGVIGHGAAAAEVLLVTLVVRRALRARSVARAVADDDPVVRIEAAARELAGDNRAAAIVATEIGILWYALGSWRSQAVVEGGDAFRYDRRSGYGGIAAAILVAIAVEIVPVHAVVAQWSGAAAWVATALTVYGGLWIVGDWRAARLRPILLDHAALYVRVGLRWDVRIPLDRIAQVERVRSMAADQGVDLRAALTRDASVRLELTTPVVANGAYGVRRSVRSLALSPDDPQRFLERLQTRLRQG
jgi:hypothetical protein